MMEQCVDHLSSMRKSHELNRQMQFILGQEITKMESLLALNKEKQATLVNIIQAEERLRKTAISRNFRRARVFAAPYFHDAKQMAAPPNEDEIIKRRNREANSFFLRPPRPWTAEEYKKLNLGLVSYAISSALKPLWRERDRTKDKLQDTIISAKEREDLEDDLYVVEQKIRLVKRKPLPEVMEQLKELNIDWMIVSATHMEGIRSPEECEIMWKNYLRFDVNKEPFSVEEGNKLWHLAQKNNEKNWDAIASSLKTNRTAIQCCQRYQTTMGANVRKKYWTKEEDDLLIELVEKHRNGVIPWGKISLLMEGRTRTQIRDRYYRGKRICYHGAFTPEEDAIVVALHQKHGRKWSTIQLYLKRRSVEQIRERFSALEPDKKAGPWTEDEDRLLITMVRRHGYGQWAKIAREIPGRDDHQCLVRTGRLLNWSIEYHSERGTEYDPDVYDPELFARILRVRPRFKYRHYHRISYSKIKPNREIALKRLFQALKVVVPEYAAGIKDVNDIDVSWMSIELMHKLSDELHTDIPEMEDMVEIFKRPPVIRKKHEHVRKTVETESDDEDYVQPPQEHIPKEENNLVKSALDTMLEMQGNVRCPYIMRKVQEIGLVQWAEMSLYAEYLYKQFHCKTLCDKDEDDEKVVFRQVDYEKSLQNAINCCIQPPVYDNQFIVLTPNMTTMTGMETVEATEDRLHSMSECASHSKPYIDYLCERRKSPPQCLQCLHRSGEIASSATPQSVMSDMKKKSFLLNKRLEDSAYMEGASIKRVSHSCVCKDLEDSKNSVQLLRKRFISLFMWPALLSAVGFNEEQENLLISERFKGPDIGHKGIEDIEIGHKATQDPDCYDITSPMEFQTSKECRQKTKRKRKASAQKRATKKPKLDEPIDDDVVCLN